MTGSQKKQTLYVRMPSSRSYKLSHYRIDENHSNTYSVWKSLGKPLIPNKDQMNQIESAQGLELFEPVSIIKPDGNNILIPLVLPTSFSLFAGV